MANTKEYKMGMDFTAKTFAGLEEMLANELREIGADDVKPINRGVQFRGDTRMLFKANYLTRTSLRILKPIGVFKVTDPDELYAKVKNIDWSTVFNIDQTFIVNANVFYSELNHSHFVALKTKDAIVDQFRDKTGKRPWVGKDDAQIFIDVHISHDVCTISLDSSGESLHRRGYRIAADKAPINEVLAAGMVQLTGWKGDKDFYDPMCGSATIPMEAAMLAMNIPAGYYRENYAFMSWADFDRELWTSVKEEADLNLADLDCRIIASDRSEKAVKLARRNLKNAGLHKDIEISTRYFDSIKPEEKGGILVFNPPYGKRLEEKGELFDLYRQIGDVLKQNFTGFEAWIISSNFEAAKFVGLRPSARLPLYNGPIETRFIKFEMYEGSKKDLYEQEDGERKDFRKDDGDRRKDYRKRNLEKRKISGKGRMTLEKITKKETEEKEKIIGKGLMMTGKISVKEMMVTEKTFEEKRVAYKKDFRKREDDDKRKFHKREDDSGKSFRKRDGGYKKDFRKRDDGDKDKFRKREDGSGRSFRKRDGGYKKDFRKKDDDRKRDFKKRDDGKKRDFHQKDEVKRRPIKKKDDNIQVLRPVKDKKDEGPESKE